jgi:DnaK suppressor protein
MDEAHARELLARERARVERELAELSAELRSDTGELSHVDDPGEQGTELFVKELDEGRRQDLLEELAAIERAERRLEEGTYGRSVQSGEPIPDARLELIPRAERTAEEEARLERGGP